MDIAVSPIASIPIKMPLMAPSVPSLTPSIIDFSRWESEPGFTCEGPFLNALLACGECWRLGVALRWLVAGVM